MPALSPVHFRPPPAVPVEGRMEQSDRRMLADLSPLRLLREYQGRVRAAEAVAVTITATLADRVAATEAADRAEREVLDRLGSLYKQTRSAR
jgi:hypothetical protein